MLHVCLSLFDFIPMHNIRISHCNYLCLLNCMMKVQNLPKNLKWTPSYRPGNNFFLFPPPQTMKSIIVYQRVMEHIQEHEPLQQRARASSPTWARSSNLGSGERREAVKSSRKQQKVLVLSDL